MYKTGLQSLFIMASLLLFSTLAYPATTGKVAGTVTDAETGEPLPGVNVILQGTEFGAATNGDGYYVILNIPPGSYTLRASMIGYAQYSVTNVKVTVDLTTTIDIQMETEAIAGQQVEIVAERPVVDKDVSSSRTTVTSEQVSNLPAIQTVGDVVGLQAGALGYEIRGGSTQETAFLLDGFTLRDERTNEPITTVSLSAVQEINIQTGGFNAEYGNIQSGLINVVTKEGSRNQYSGVLTYRYSPPAPKHFGPSAYAKDSYWNRPYLDDVVAWTGTDNGEPWVDQNGNGMLDGEWYRDLNGNGRPDWGEPWEDENNNGQWDPSGVDDYTDLNGDGTWTIWPEDQYPRHPGWNLKSQETLTDNDPTNDLSPRAAQLVYMWQHRRQGDIDRPDYNLDFGFGGPFPFLSSQLGDLRFYFSHRQEQNMYLIPLSRDGVTDYFSLLKLTSNLTSDTKLTVSSTYSTTYGTNDNNVGLPGYFSANWQVAGVLSSRSYIDAIMYGTDYFAPTEINRYNVAAKLTRTLSSNSFYEFKVEHTGNLYNTEPNPLRDTTAVISFGEGKQYDEAPYGYMPYPSSGINGLRMGVGMSNSRDYSEIYTTAASFDFSSQINSTNQIKSGLEFVYNKHKVEYGAVELTLPSGRPWSIWTKTPIRGAAYVQDKMEFEGLVANIGVRMDYSHAGGEWYAFDNKDFFYRRDFLSSNYTEAANDTIPKEPTSHKVYLSPRIGISHPITQNSKLFFNYGHFRQMPEAERLYLVQRVTEGSVSRIGNPNNDLQRTVMYELGYEHNIFGKYLLHLSAYYKDVTNQPNWVQYISSDSKVNYYYAQDNYYKDIRGLEFQLEKRIGTWLSGFLNYTYTVETTGYFGKLDYRENPAEQRAIDRENIYQEKPLPRPYARANITFHTPPEFGPRFAGIGWFADWRLSLLGIWREGQYDTWTGGVSIPGIEYNVQWPDYYNLELKLSKNVKVDNYNVQFFVEVDNLLNTKIFSSYAFSEGNDRRDYFNSLLWPKEIGEPIGNTRFGNDQIGDLRPDDVPYSPFENELDLLPNPNDDPTIAAQNQDRMEMNEGIRERNQWRRKTKAYINNPNLEWLYYLNPRDIHVGIRIEF